MERCPACEAPLSRPHDERVSELRAQARYLRRRLADLGRGRRRPEEIAGELARLCPACRAVVGPLPARGTGEEIARRLRRALAGIEATIGAIEPSPP